jgi:glyoxylase-like metal-dependent hydrolase (beta-lactamase superfamily II)
MARPAIDPLGEDQELLERSRARLLALQPAVIIPGHGTPFAPSELAPEAAGQ